MRIPKVLIVVVLLCSAAFAERLRQIAMIDLAGQPGFDAVGIANGALLMAHSAANSVDIFDLSKRRVVARVEHVRGAAGIAVDESGGRVFLSSPDRESIVVISTESWDVQKVIPVKVPVESILYVPSVNRLYLANSRDQSMGYIDFAHNADVKTADAGGLPERLAFDPAKKLIYATLQDKRQIGVYDLELKPQAYWTVKGSQPTGLALDANSRRLYVAVRYAVLALNADTGAELNRVGAPAGVDALWLDAADHKLLAASGGTVCIMEIQANGLTRGDELNINVRGHSLAYDPETKLIYVPGGREGRSKLLILKPLPGNVPTFADGKHAKQQAFGQ
ncbi:MAG: YncE family protein [Terriglobales bacterium]